MCRIFRVRRSELQGLCGSLSRAQAAGEEQRDAGHPDQTSACVGYSERI